MEMLGWLLFENNVGRKEAWQYLEGHSQSSVGREGLLHAPLPPLLPLLHTLP